MRSLLLIVTLVAACRSSEPAEPAPSKPVPRTADCAPTHEAIDLACAPRFDACSDGQIATLGGGCRAVGVPADGCAKGFTHDGKGACTPVLPAKCDPGMFARPGESTCRAIDECGTARYPTVTGAALYVDGAYAGTDSDGTEGKPYRTIAAALARTDATTLAIAAGSYPGDLVVDRAVQLIGVCSSKVEIAGVATGTEAAAVTVRAAASLAHLSIAGPAHGVLVDNTTVKLDALRVHDTGGAGVWIRRGAIGTLGASLVEHGTDYGVVVTGATATIADSVVRGTKHVDVGVGVQANPSNTSTTATSVRIERSVLERNEGVAVRASGAPITIESSVIRDTLPHPDGTWGVGGYAEVHPPSGQSGSLSFVRSVVDKSRYFGVVANSSTVSLDRSVVRGTEPEVKRGTLGRGVAAQGPTKAIAKLVIRDSAILQNHEAGVDAVGAADVLLERALIADTRAIGPSGAGVVALRLDKTGVAPKLAIADSTIERNAIAGVLAYGGVEVSGSRVAGNGTYGFLLRGGTSKLARTVIVGIAGEKAGQGVYAEPEGDTQPDLALEDVLIERTSVAGVVFAGATLMADRVRVRDVSSSAEGKAGVGMMISRRSPTLEPKAFLTSFVVERVMGAGLFFAGARGELTRCVVRETRVVTGGFGDGVVASGVVFPALGVRPSTITVSDSLFERNARAGIGLFGSTLRVGGTYATCNGIDIDLESTAAMGPDGPVDATPMLEDLGGNQCGCDPFGPCRAQSTGLGPVPPE